MTSESINLDAIRARDANNVHTCEHLDRRALLIEVDRLAASLAERDRRIAEALAAADPPPYLPLDRLNKVLDALTHFLPDNADQWPR